MAPQVSHLSVRLTRLTWILSLKGNLTRLEARTQRWWTLNLTRKLRAISHLLIYLPPEKLDPGKSLQSLPNLQINLSHLERSWRGPRPSTRTDIWQRSLRSLRRLRHHAKLPKEILPINTMKKLRSSHHERKQHLLPIRRLSPTRTLKLMAKLPTSTTRSLTSSIREPASDLWLNSLSSSSNLSRRSG